VTVCDLLKNAAAQVVKFIINIKRDAKNDRITEVSDIKADLGDVGAIVTRIEESRAAQSFFESFV
jgi:hypothetical protein